jgi:dolichol kinase
MLAFIRKFFSDILTERDNKTYDMSRTVLLLSVISYICFTVWHLAKLPTTVFEFVSWGSGMATILGAGGVAIGIKTGSEPLDGDRNK